MSALASNRKLNVAFVVVAAVAYLATTFSAPKAASSGQYNLPPVAVLLITVTVLALWMLTIFYGLFAWLTLDRYAGMLPKKSDRQAFTRIASGVRLLAYSLLVSSILSAAVPYFSNSPVVAEAVKQANYYMILIFPFLGFLWLRQGTRRLAVTAQATLTLKAKLLTVGPPVLVLAAFYIFLAATNSTPGAPSASGTPLDFALLLVSIALVVGSWVWGLLTALNIERATHGAGTAAYSRSLVRLYNGVLTMTGGFIILDALSSLGATRLAALPFGIVVALLYAFIGVICLGFAIVAASGRALISEAKTRA